MFSRFSVVLLGALVLSVGRFPAEVIYDNTQFNLEGYASETLEYGDQIDLQGTARTLTELTFYYYGSFVADGDEGMKVRLYSNETPFDSFRQAPTRILYESGTMPLKEGYNLRTIENLNVKLPGNTVTFAIEFKGLATNEVAGVLLYAPPTIGWSFNEFWGRTAAGGWSPFLYSTTDPARKANAGLKLVARTDAELTAAQTNQSTSVLLRDSTSNFRLAQTFRAETNGRLDHVTFSFETSNSPIQLSLLDVDGSQPGTNVIFTQMIEPNAEGKIEAGLYERDIFLKAGKLYALALQATNAPASGAQVRVLASTNNPYTLGELWMRTNSASASWKAVSNTNTPGVDALFSVSIVPSFPSLRIVTPTSGEVIPYGQRVAITVETNLPAISKIYRARFFDGNQEINFVTTPPYRVDWHATNSGPHNLRVVIEDTFGRLFRAEPHAITVLEAPPVPENRRLTVQKGAEGAVSLKFSSKIAEVIRVEQSENLIDWEPAGDDLTGTGEEMEFIDDGPPKTDQHPKDFPFRYYRVVFGP